MGERVPIPIARRQGEAKSKFVSAQTLTNAFLEMDSETGEFAIYKAPGLTLLKAVTGAPVRGVHDFGGVCLAVVGGTLYTVNAGGIATARGSVLGSLPVIMSNNGFEAVIVADANSYVWDGTTLAEITDPDFYTASSVDFLDQYMIFTKANSGSFFLSALADAQDYDALDIASAESRPDELVRVIVQNREALLLGTKSVEDWYNAGDPDFPLVRSQTYVDDLGVGLMGKHAVAIIDNSVAWLTVSKTVRILRGGSAQVISDAMVTAEIETWADPTLTVVFAFAFRGHQYLVLRNPDGCLLWDASLPPAIAWSSRKSYNSETWRVVCAETMPQSQGWGGRLVCGDEAGNLYFLSADALDENGEPLVWQLTSRTMGPGGQPFTLDAIEIEAEPGISLVSGQGSDAKIWLEVSRDSGFTFGARLERSLGVIGVRNRRLVWRNLGQFRPHGGVLRISGSDPVANVLTKGWADIQVDAA